MTRGRGRLGLVYAAIAVFPLSVKSAESDTSRFSPDSTSFPCPFGPPFVQISRGSSEVGFGEEFDLSPSQAATWNIRHTGDLFQGDLRFFHPDLVVAGRPVRLSPDGLGAQYARVIWRGRPMRDPWTFQADLGWLPTAFVGSARTTHTGIIDGVAVSAGGAALEVVQPQTNQPVTYLHHRDGFYDFAPVEFVHTRLIGKQMRLTAGGFFPSSAGRWPHANYGGQSLLGQVERSWENGSQVSVAFNDGRLRAEVPWSDSTRLLDRDELDLALSLPFGGHALEINAYDVRHRESYFGSGRGRRESGLVFRGKASRFFSSWRVSHFSGDVGEGHRIYRDELEVLVGGVRKTKAVRCGLGVGFSGWIQDQLEPQGAVWVEGGGLKRWSWRLSAARTTPTPPLERFANQPADALQPLPSEPFTEPERNLPGKASPLSSVELTLSREWAGGLATATGFGWWTSRLVVGEAVPDSERKTLTADGAHLTGWRVAYRKIWGDWDGEVAAVGFQRRSRRMPQGGYFHPEPNLRASAAAGWHRSFFAGNLEADVRFTARWFGTFNAWSGASWEELGGAYPLDARATVRIRRFTFYYGLHNWNSFPYYLVPGYRMMHREEYWGIHWTLLN